MPLVVSGRFLVKVPESTWERALGFLGGETEPVFEEERRSDQRPVAPGWLLHTPAPRDSRPHPWDEAHEIAARLRAQLRASGVTGTLPVYVEPDIVHRRLIETTHARPVVGSAYEGWPALRGLDRYYSPCDDKFDLDWHIQYAGFREAWAAGGTQGEGVRIAHLDTGYYPCHLSTPVNMREGEGRNYYQGDPKDVVDPGNHLNEGHGTATLALLAGKDVDLTYQANKKSPIHRFTGIIGGAPGAAIVPVRIGGIDGSVIHLYSVSMAKGLLHALGDAQRAPCDLVSLSHGGLPTQLWVEAVNELYEQGIVVVAASGDNFNGWVLDIATHFTVYPAAWWRVITVTGETFARRSYTSKHILEMQGCWGPWELMDKSLGAFTPNVPWMKLHCPTAWEADGSGTSASTPQVAAACALWLAVYGGDLPNDWRRVEAFRKVLFHALQDQGRDANKIGSGALDAACLLQDTEFSNAVVADAKRAKPTLISRTPPDQCSWPLLRLLLGLPPPRGGVNGMLNVEAQQVAYRSRNPKIQPYLEAPEGGHRTRRRAPVPGFAEAFLREPEISNSLRTWVQAQMSPRRGRAHKKARGTARRGK